MIMDNARHLYAQQLLLIHTRSLCDIFRVLRTFFINMYVATNENLSLGDFATENRFVCRRKR